MTKFWFDTNFFLPATQMDKNLRTLKILLKEIKDEYPLYTTSRIKKELDNSAFKHQIPLYFKIERVEDTQEFKNFVEENKRFLGLSKARNEPADLSLAYIASISTEKEYIITNDEGFLLLKKDKPEIMKNVVIREPTDFLKELIIKKEFDEKFEREVEELIISYAEYFIMHRLGIEKGERPIERILKSILAFGQNIISYSLESNLPEVYKTPLDKYIHNQELNYEERIKIKPARKFFKPLAEYYETYENGEISSISSEKEHQTNLLYLKTPEIIDDLNLIEYNKEDNILHYTHALKDLIEKEIFRIRIQFTINYLKDCYFDEAFYHFRPIVESHWNISISKERKGMLRLLFGIFLLNLQDFEFFEYLLNMGFWDEFKRLKDLFGTLLKTLKSEIDEIGNLNVERELFGSDLSLLYNLGLYFANTGNILGLKIFNLIFKLDRNTLQSLEWADGFLERYLLELRIHQLEITDSMRDKFLNFLESRKLEDNTESKLDRNYELEEFTYVEKAPYFYSQPFFLINYQSGNDGIEAYCWNNTIRSIVILEIPNEIKAHLENVRSLKIQEGKVITKNIPITEKGQKHARIIIKVHETSDLEFKRFNIKIGNK